MDIFKILRADPFYGEGEAIEIAKGKYELVDTIQGGINKIKRQYYGKGRH